MSQRQLHVLAASAVVPAPPERVYDLIADYRNGHPRIVPKQFTNMVVEQGGFGDGTVIRFDVRLWGRTMTCRAAITEPEPGRVLVETGLDANRHVTTFRVDRANGHHSRVTIATTLPVRSGLLGAIERWFSGRMLIPLYNEELAILTSVATATAVPVAS